MIQVELHISVSNWEFWMGFEASNELYHEECSPIGLDEESGQPSSFKGIKFVIQARVEDVFGHSNFRIS